MPTIENYLDSVEQINAAAKMPDAAPVFEHNDYFETPSNVTFLAGVEYTDSDIDPSAFNGQRVFVEIENLDEAYDLQAIDALVTTPKLTAALRGVLDRHHKTPLYDVQAGDCEHGEDCEGIELEPSETYCPDHIAYYTCECMLDYSSANEFPEYPCDEVKAIAAALDVGE